MTQALKDVNTEQDDPNEVICSLMDEILALTQERDVLRRMLTGELRAAREEEQP